MERQFSGAGQEMVDSNAVFPTEQIHTLFSGILVKDWVCADPDGGIHGSHSKRQFDRASVSPLP